MSTAEHLFSQITYGKKNAIPRPFNRAADRSLRDRVSQWNKNKKNDPIINVGAGYYKPRPWIPEEVLDFNQYMATESPRIKSTSIKLNSMRASFKRMEKECSGEKEQYEQLSLPFE